VFPAAAIRWRLDLEAAEAVGAGGNVNASDVLDLLTHLVEKSLVNWTPKERVTNCWRRWQYAHERLDESGETNQTALDTSLTTSHLFRARTKGSSARNRGVAVAT
jgi:hypothetical protein